MNPFSRNRYEYIPTHLYYLPSGLIETLEDSRPSYVIGSRGSGKTTLLKALNWEERLENKWLNKELGGEAFRGRFIATYTKLPLVQLKAFQEWLASEKEVTHSLLFGYYFDLVSAETLAYSLGRVTNTLHFDVDLDAEEEGIREFVQENDYLLEGYKRKSPTTVAECHELIRAQRRRLERFAISEQPTGECLASMTIPVTGEVAKSFGKHMAKALDDSTNAGLSDKWHFKCCFDEAECLSQHQLVVVNSIIRTSNWPVSYVISFVGEPEDLSLTIHDNLTVQKADRSTIHLDGLSRPEFEELCDGVGNIRINATLETTHPNEGHEIEFKTSSVLGKLDLNAIVTDLVKRSEGPTARKLQTLAEDFRSSPWVKTRESEFAPYVEAYLAKKLNLDPPDSSLPGGKRAQASREFRKKFVASYLSICRELGVKKIPYAYANMVFGISDTCVRDYLAQMHQIFEKAKLPLVDLLDGGISWEVQSDAIRNASIEKRQSIKTGDDVSNPERVRRLTIALGELTGVLQRGEPKTVTHLRSSERGLFHFGEPLTDGGSDDELYSILKDASEAGFLRLKRDGKQILGFKVHASMAPAFGFSYRGAYYPVAIQKSDLFAILQTPEDDELVTIARRIASRLLAGRADPDQKTLFPLEDGEALFDDDD
ncbi:MAG: hypothetical protein HQ567_02395 [Candidatus Nealsonbacteria bacterium]|nr:hypothetical protein [Candidatus Nealsonbacteria bacterium]